MVVVVGGTVVVVVVVGGGAGAQTRRRRSMHIVKGSQTSPDALKGASLAIGNFDGVHRGHVARFRLDLMDGTRLAIEVTVEYERRTVPCTVVERPFFRHPRTRA